MFLEAIPDYFQRGWTPLPLGLDANGKPKRPITRAWQTTPHSLETVKALPWGDAKGLGIMLGPASDNLAVIDVDDNALARGIWSLLVRGHVKARLVFTGRNNLHVYCREQSPSNPTAFKVLYQGHECGIELKGKGQQVAAPPTPGYTLSWDEPPIACPNIRAVWAQIARKLNLSTPAETSNFPQAWQESVPTGERNKAIYIEAHRLREARMPLTQALGILQTRWQRDYEQGGQGWPEAERTVRSAYRLGGLVEAGGVEERWGAEY